MRHDELRNAILNQLDPVDDLNGCDGHESSADVSCRFSSTSADAAAEITSTAELTDRIRQSKKTLLFQAQRIEQLESVLICIVALNAKLRKLELEAEESSAVDTMQPTVMGNSESDFTWDL